MSCSAGMMSDSSAEFGLTVALFAWRLRCVFGGCPRAITRVLGVTMNYQTWKYGGHHTLFVDQHQIRGLDGFGVF